MSKIDFFKVLQTFRGWFLSGLDRLRGVVSTLKPFYHTTRRFWKKSIFWSKNDTFCLQSVCQVGVKNAFFESKNRFFQNSSNFQGIVTIGFGQAWGCCFDLKTVLSYHTPILRKIDFLIKKLRFSPLKIG